MTLFNNDPNDETEPEGWRETIRILHRMIEHERQLNAALTKQRDFLYETCEQLDAMNHTLKLLSGERKEMILLLKERIAQHEQGMVHHHLLRQN